MIANKKFIVALALIVALVAMVASAEPDEKVCREEVPAKEGDAACEKCCNQHGFVHGYIGGMMKWRACSCMTYDPEDPAVKAPGLASIFGAALAQ